MYPSENNVRYGIFVKRFGNLLIDDFDIHRIVITKKYNVLSKLFAYFKAYISIIKLLFTSKTTDIIYVHFPLHFAPILLPFILKKRKLVLNFHGSDVIFDSPIKKTLAYFLYPLVKKSNIVVPSTYYEGIVSKAFNISNKSIFVYPSGGIDSNIFYPINSTGNIFTLGFISNFIESKGWRLLLESVKNITLNNSIYPLKVIMVGDGPDKVKIKKFIKINNLDVELLDSVEQENLSKIYSKFDVFIFPTYRKAESLGLVGIEALSCGIPVITSNIGGPSGYIKNEVNGYLFEPQNSDELTCSILKYYSLPQNEKDKMKKEALISSEKFDSIKVTNELKHYLRSI
jgi:glycosyltransferase involved in cell wall biosynthesis